MVLPEDKIIHDGDTRDGHYHDYREEDVPSEEDEDDDDEEAHSEAETQTDNVLSIIPDNENHEMTEQNRMLFKSLLEQHAQCEEEHKSALAELDHSRCAEQNETTEPTQSEIFKLANSVRYCDGGKESDMFLHSLRSNIDTHKHLFPNGRRNRVNYAISFHNWWNNPTDASG